MGAVCVFIIYSIVAIGGQCEVTLMADKPSESVRASESADLACCFNTTVEQFHVTWVRQFRQNATDRLVHLTRPVTKKAGFHCHRFMTGPLSSNDSGLYQCWLNGSINIFTHGTYVRVFEPLKKTINLSEKAKNRILIAEGVLLFLCVLLPSSTLLFKSKKLQELEKKKARREEENIYQGLNLDDCCATYDQIERSKADGPYQDVANIEEEEEDVQLEKP